MPRCVVRCCFCCRSSSPPAAARLLRPSLRRSPCTSTGAGRSRAWVFAPSTQPHLIVLFVHGLGNTRETTPYYHRPVARASRTRRLRGRLPGYETFPYQANGLKHLVQGVAAALPHVAKGVPVAAIGYSRGGRLVMDYASIASATGLVPGRIFSLYPSGIMDRAAQPRTAQRAHEGADPRRRQGHDRGHDRREPARDAARGERVPVRGCPLREPCTRTARSSPTISRYSVTRRRHSGRTGHAPTDSSRRSSRQHRPSPELRLRHAGVAELADAPGLGPGGPRGPWRFDPSRPHRRHHGRKLRISSSGARSFSGGSLATGPRWMRATMPSFGSSPSALLACRLVERRGRAPVAREPALGRPEQHRVDGARRRVEILVRPCADRRTAPPSRATSVGARRSLIASFSPHAASSLERASGPRTRKRQGCVSL